LIYPTLAPAELSYVLVGATLFTGATTFTFTKSGSVFSFRPAGGLMEWSLNMMRKDADDHMGNWRALFI
jgi:hypothetical protein